MVRCDWAQTELGIAYHDEEWGVPRHDDRVLFEFLILEGAQAGLSWETILRKRATYRAAFADFDPAKVAAFGPRIGNPARLKDTDAERPTFIDDGWTRRYRAVEIYEVSGAHRAVVASATPLVVGGPEDLMELSDSGLLGDAPNHIQHLANVTDLHRKVFDHGGGGGDFRGCTVDRRHRIPSLVATVAGFLAG